jgi:formamidopyrimidine-DNA glycosylase
MPEGHSVHRIARQFDRHFVGKPLTASSPQGRFGDARLIDGSVLVRSYAVGKHLFLEFDSGLTMHVHLGIYGAWDFAGSVALDDTALSAAGRMGQTNGRGTVVGKHEDSLASIGAPRRTRLRIGEQELRGGAPVEFPPDPVGQVRARLLSDDAVADLRGPTVCEVIDANRVAAIRDELGPDPLVDSDGAARFRARLARTGTPIGRALMNQKIVAGIGNVYRAEMLFRARLSPYVPANSLSIETVDALWRDWEHLLAIGVETGQMLTMDKMTAAQRTAALANRDYRHWVYRRAGEPCRACGTAIVLDIMEARKLYFCPACQGVSA